MTSNTGSLAAEGSLEALLATLKAHNVVSFEGLGLKVTFGPAEAPVPRVPLVPEPPKPSKSILQLLEEQGLAPDLMRDPWLDQPVDPISDAKEE